MLRVLGLGPPVVFPGSLHLQVVPVLKSYNKHLKIEVVIYTFVLIPY